MIASAPLLVTAPPAVIPYVPDTVDAPSIIAFVSVAATLAPVTTNVPKLLDDSSRVTF